MVNKLVLFDWEGVILRKYPQPHSSKEAIINTIKFFNNSLTEDDAYTAYRATLKDEKGVYVSQYNDDINITKWFERLKEKSNLTAEKADFYNKFEEEFLKTEPYKDVVELIHSLKEKCNVGVFSDLILYCGKALDKQVDFNTLDYVFLSYETGLLKTDIKAFENVEKITKIEPENILFIDDNDFNLENARNRGWNTCLAEGFEIEKINKEINKFLYN